MDNMVIESLKHQYYVIHRKEKRAGYEIFFCREYGEVWDGMYDVYCVSQPLLIQRLILELTNRKKREDFTDLYEYFSWDGRLYLVFLHKEGVPLEEWIGEDGRSFKERLEIGRVILERILLLSVPDYFITEIWRKEQILVNDGEVGFRYQLEGIFMENGEREEQIRFGLANLLEQLFEEEIVFEKSLEVLELIERIRDRDTGNVWEVYQDYQKFLDRIFGLKEELHPNTILFRIWNRIKMGFPYIRWGIRILLVFVLAGYLIYTILYPSEEVEFLKYESIGSLVILK